MAKLDWRKAQQGRHMTGESDRALQRELRRLGVKVAPSAWDPNPVVPRAIAGIVKHWAKKPVRFGPRR